MAARNYSDIAVATTLASGMTDSDTTLAVVSATGWPAAPFILVIDPDTANEEVVLVGAKSGTTFSSLTRGFAGTSALAHNASRPLEHVITGVDIALIWTHAHSGDFAPIDHANLIAVGTDDHHARDHSLIGSTHTASGLTPGHALLATGATTFDFGQVDHGELAGLTDDDHPDYLNAARHTADAHAGLVHTAVAGEIAGVTLKASPAINDLILIEDSADANAKKRVTLSSLVSAGSTTDHGTLDGLSDDDHTDYYNAARHTKAVHDALGIDAATVGGELPSAFANASHGDHGLATHKSSGDHDGRYYTEAEVNSLLSGKANTSHGSHSATSYSDTHVIQQGNYTRINDAAGEEVLTLDRSDWAYFGQGVQVPSLWASALWPHNNTFSTVRLQGSGQVYQAFTTSSEALKKQIKPIDLDKALFDRLDPMWFKYRQDHPLRKGFGEYWASFENPDEFGRMGFSYEQVQKVAPHWTYEVEQDGESYGVIAFEGMLPDFMAWAVAAIKDLRERVAV